MKANSQITISKRIIVIFLAVLLVFAAFNTYLMLERISSPSTSGAIAYDFVLSQQGKNYQLKNMLTGSTTSVTGDASSAINSALVNGNSVYLNAGTYTLNDDIVASNKMNSKIDSNGATIIANGHKIIFRGANFTLSKYNSISDLTIIGGTLRIENSFGTTISNIIFENTTTGIEIVNTNTWSENTQIENCNFFNATEGIAFRTPASDNATGSYASSEIDRCFFNLRDNSVAINVEPLAEFSDSQLHDDRMWLGQDGHTNQTGLLLNGTMHQSLLFGVVFESFTDVPNDLFAIDIGQTAITTPIIDGGVSFLGNWTAMIHNPFSKWISSVSTAFEKTNVNVSVGLNSQFGANASIQQLPLKIFSFKPQIKVSGSFPSNETITVRIRVKYVDNSISQSVLKTFTNSSSTWLTDDDMMQLYPSQNVIWAIVIDAQSSLSASDATVTVNGYGTAG